MAKNLNAGSGDGETSFDASGLLVSVKNREELNELEARNNAKAYEKYLLFERLGKKNLLAAALLCEIHREMFGGIWSWAGEFRKAEKNIGVPAAKIGSELHRLSFDFNHWEEKKMPALDAAVRMHHRLVWIHPFENGNGRWARLVTNLYLLRKKAPLVEWPGDMNVIREVFKPAYIGALKKADHGDYDPLAGLHRQYIK